MLANAVSEDEKALVQGANKTMIVSVSTLCTIAAVAIIARFGWAVLATVSFGLLVLASVKYVKETLTIS